MPDDFRPSLSESVPVMRPLCLLCLALLAMPVARGQPVKARQSKLACEWLCAELFTAIRANPGAMVMRLEEALIINEGCAPELVTAAIDAVNADPAMVQKIVETANEIAPSKSAGIAMAVRNYSAPVLTVQAHEEVRRAEVPVPAAPQPLPGEVVRRAELPLDTRSIPIFEVRRAEVIMPVQPPSPDEPLSDVPKASPAR